MNVFRVGMASPRVVQKVSFGKADGGDGPISRPLRLDETATMLLQETKKKKLINDSDAYRISGAITIAELNEGLPSVEIQRRGPKATQMLKDFVAEFASKVK